MPAANVRLWYMMPMEMERSGCIYSKRAEMMERFSNERATEKPQSISDGVKVGFTA